MTEIRVELARLADGLVDEEEVTRALGDFEGVWTALTPREQARVLTLLIERVEYDGQGGNISITFRPTGIKTLAVNIAAEEKDAT